MRLLRIFSSPSCWAKNCVAINNDGKKTGINGPYTDNQMDMLQHIKQFSLYGAISFFFPHQEERADMMNSLRRGIASYTGKNMSVAAFNDAPETTYEDLIRVIKRSFAR